MTSEYQKNLRALSVKWYYYSNSQKWKHLGKLGSSDWYNESFPAVSNTPIPLPHQIIKVTHFSINK